MGEWTEKLPQDLRGEMPAFDSLREYLNDNPKRDAVLKWLDKLEEWCADRLTESASDDKKMTEYSDKIDKLEEELAGMRDDRLELESLEEQLEDVVRGLRTLEDVLDENRRRHLV